MNENQDMKSQQHNIPMASRCQGHRPRRDPGALLHDIYTKKICKAHSLARLWGDQWRHTAGAYSILTIWVRNVAYIVAIHKFEPFPRFIVLQDWYCAMYFAHMVYRGKAQQGWILRDSRTLSNAALSRWIL